MNRFTFLIPVIALAAACATVLDGRKQQLGFDSNEKDVEIFINGQFACKTPCITEVSRKKEKLMITARKDGFEDKTVFTDVNMNPTSVFNVISLWTSTFGFTTDMTSSTIWQYQPGSFYVTMLKEPKTEAEKRRYAEQNKIRQFVLTNFEQLQSEAYQDASSKEYLAALEKLSHISQPDIASIIQNSYAAPDAAENIVGRYLRNNP